MDACLNAGWMRDLTAKWRGVGFVLRVSPKPAVQSINLMDVHKPSHFS